MCSSSSSSSLNIFNQYMRLCYSFFEAWQGLDCKTVGFFSKSVKKSAKRGVRVVRARSANLTLCQTFHTSSPLRSVELSKE